MEGEDPFAFHATALGLVGSLGDARLGQAAKARRVLDYDFEGVGGVEKVFVECQIEVGKLGVDGLEFLFLVGIEEGAVANEALVIFLYGAALVGLEALAVVVDGLDALEEGVVHGHLVAELRVCRIEFLGDFYHLGRRVRLVEGEEYHGHAVEDFARTLKGHDGVVEGWSLGVVDD